MTDYRRFCIPGSTWFFTVNLAERRGNNLLVERIDLLRTAFAYVKQRRPYRMDAVVIMPDHLHCIWTLPPTDAEFSTRWTLLKSHFSRAILPGERVSPSRVKRRERGLWQRRFWAHLLKDHDDFNNHVDYIHWNPVKHGYVRRVADWPHSSFHRFLALGIYPAEWVIPAISVFMPTNNSSDALKNKAHPTGFWVRGQEGFGVRRGLGSEEGFGVKSCLLLLC